MNQTSINRLGIAFGLAGALAGIVAVFKYFDDKKQDVLKGEVLALDREIKELELSKRLTEQAKAKV